MPPAPAQRPAAAPALSLSLLRSPQPRRCNDAITGLIDRGGCLQQQGQSPSMPTTLMGGPELEEEGASEVLGIHTTSNPNPSSGAVPTGDTSRAWSHGVI
ncbi:unnamed protein product [Boreogadus saida]